MESLAKEFCLEYYKREKIIAFSVLAGGLAVRYYLIPNYIEIPQKYTFASLSPAFFPILTAWFIVGLALLYLIHNILLTRGKSHVEGKSDWISTGEERMAYVCTVVIIIYLLVLGTLGFLISTVLFLAALLVLQGVRKPFKVALISVLVTMGIYLFFLYVMKIHFPKGIIFE
jgi:putative tricarboxylic transport membrane protein